MEQPIKYWVPSIAPSSMALYQGDMFPNWKGNLFISALVPGEKVVGEETLFSELGRIRNVITAPDGSLILATDGAEGKIIRVFADNQID